MGARRQTGVLGAGAGMNPGEGARLPGDDVRAQAGQGAPGPVPELLRDRTDRGSA